MNSNYKINKIKKLYDGFFKLHEINFDHKNTMVNGITMSQEKFLVVLMYQYFYHMILLKKQYFY